MDQICELEILVTQVKQESSQSVTNLIREGKEGQETVARLSDRVATLAEQKDDLTRVSSEIQASLRSLIDQCQATGNFAITLMDSCLEQIGVSGQTMHGGCLAINHKQTEVKLNLQKDILLETSKQLKKHCVNIDRN